MGNLGSADSTLSEPHRAIDCYEQELVIAREIGDRQGESITSWNLGDEYVKQGELEKAITLMQFCVDYERELGHTDAEKDAARVEEIRKRLAGG